MWQTFFHFDITASWPSYQFLAEMCAPNQRWLLALFPLSCTVWNEAKYPDSSAALLFWWCYLKLDINMWSFRDGPQQSISLQNLRLRTEPCCWRSTKVSQEHLTQSPFVLLTCCGLLQQTAWMCRNVFVTDQWCDACKVLHENTGNHMPNGTPVGGAGTLGQFG